MRFFKKKYVIEVFLGVNQFKIRKAKIFFPFWWEKVLIDIPCAIPCAPRDCFYFCQDIHSFLEKDEKTNHYSRFILSEDRYALFLLRFADG